MAVNVVRFRRGERAGWGFVDGDQVHAIEGEYATTRAFMLEGAERARAGATSAAPVPLSELEVLCPVTPDRQFLCQAINYHSHMRESGFDPAKAFVGGVFAFDGDLDRAESAAGTMAIVVRTPIAKPLLTYFEDKFSDDDEDEDETDPASSPNTKIPQSKPQS